MAKNLRLHVAPPSSPFSGYPVGSDVRGTVTVVSDEPIADCKRIEVSLTAKASVYFFIVRSQNQPVRHYSDSETYLDVRKILWARENAESRGSLTADVHGSIFTFSFSLRSQERRSLPPSIETRDGNIRYTIEAKLIKDGDIQAEVQTERIRVNSRVNINRPDLKAPRASQTEGEVGCFCFSGGMVSLTAKVPRTGYCIGKDSIPVSIQLENNSRQSVEHITATIVKHLVCSAQSRQSEVTRYIASVTSSPIHSRKVVVWNPTTLEIPETEPSLANSNLIKVSYFLRVAASHPCSAEAQQVSIPLVLGNVPLSEDGTSSQISEVSIGDEPPLPAVVHQYYPPPISLSSQQTAMAMTNIHSSGNDEDDKDEQNDVKPLLS